MYTDKGSMRMKYAIELIAISSFLLINVVAFPNPILFLVARTASIVSCSMSATQNIV